MQYLGAADVAAAMPAPDEVISLLYDVLRRGVDREREGPAMAIVRPRASGSVAVVTPVYDAGDSRQRGVLGATWTTDYPTNAVSNLARGSSLVFVQDPEGIGELAILDGAEIMAVRGAGVSALIVRQLDPTAGRGATAGFIGAGRQAYRHVQLLARVLSDLEIVAYDIDQDRASRLVTAAQAVPGVRMAKRAHLAREAVDGADIVITSVPAGSNVGRMMPDWLAGDVLIIAVDHDQTVSAEVAKSAGMFLVDGQDSYKASLDGVRFRDYPSPDGTVSDALVKKPGWPGGHVLVTQAGIGLADVRLAMAIRSRAGQLGLGISGT